MLLTTWRLSLSVRAWRSNKRTRREPTVIVTTADQARGRVFEPAGCSCGDYPAGSKPPRGARSNEPLLFKRSLHLLHAVSFDHVVDLDVVVAGNFQAALEAFAHLADILLEALERVQ